VEEVHVNPDVADRARRAVQAMIAGDTAARHQRDTLDAGAGLGDPAAVAALASQAPAEIDRLVRLGARLDRTALHLEGGHSRSLALAARAGARLRDVEFVQFHPTVLWQEGSRGQCPLITEALRGAGAPPACGSRPRARCGAAAGRTTAWGSATQRW
jgi:aspartate oxidase